MPSVPWWPVGKPRSRESLAESVAEWSGSGGKRRKGKSGRRFVASVLVACAVVSVLVAADYWSSTGKIHRGVEVGSVALGGKTPAEAEEIVWACAVGREGNLLDRLKARLLAVVGGG